MSKSIESRIVALEAAKKTQANDLRYRPLPLSYFYGEPLPPDFHTSDKYIRREVPRLADFYSQTSAGPSRALNPNPGVKP